MQWIRLGNSEGGMLWLAQCNTYVGMYFRQGPVLVAPFFYLWPETKLPSVKYN